MNIEFAGMDPRRGSMPATQVVQVLEVQEEELLPREARLQVQLPLKAIMDHARSTIPQGVSAQKEWLGRHVAYGLSLLHSQVREYPHGAPATLRIDLQRHFHIRPQGRPGVWDGRSFTMAGGQVALLSVVLNRQDPPRKFTAEWRLYEGLRAVPGNLLLGGGCGYTIFLTPEAQT